MTIYYVLILLLLIFAYLMHGDQKRSYKYILLSAILLFCVHGLRDAETVGVDSSTSYLHQFESVRDSDWDELPKLENWWSVEKDKGEEGRDRNIGLVWLMKLVSDWTDGDYQAFIAVVSAFNMIALAVFISRFSPSPAQSILYYLGLLFFSFSISALKQCVAMSILLFAMNSVYKRRFFPFLLQVLLASMFHFPALVFLPAYWIANMKFGRTYLIMLAALMLVVFLFRDSILNWFNDIYYDEDAEHEFISSGRFLMNKVIVMLFIIAAAVIIRPPTSQDKLYNMFLQLIGIAAVLQTFSSYGNIFERLADYYFQFSVVFIPMVFEEVDLKRRHLSQRELQLVRRAGPYVFGIFAIWRFLDNVSANSSLNHYQFYFQAEKAVEELVFRSIL